VGDWGIKHLVDQRVSAEGVRLFLALDLPGEARTEIAGWRDAALVGREALRPVREEGLHVTLVFLGRRPRELVEHMWQTAAASLAGRRAPTLTPAGAIWLPPRRPRVLALDLEDRDARATLVHESLSAALQRAGLHEPELRVFAHTSPSRGCAPAQRCASRCSRLRRANLSLPAVWLFTAAISIRLVRAT